MILGSVNAFQEFVNVHQGWTEILFVVIGITPLWYILYHTKVGDTHPGRCSVAWLGVCLVILGIVLINMFPCLSYTKVAQRQTQPVSKVLYVPGTKTMQVQTKSGQAYDVPSDQVKTEFTKHQHAELTHYAKRSNVSDAMYHAARHGHAIPKDKLTMSISTKEYGNHVVEWNFK